MKAVSWRIKWFFVHVLARSELLATHRLWWRSYLRESGWYRSVREQKPVDKGGKPIPWITYPALDFLDGRVAKGMAVFEYGCGGSTLWWAGKAERVVACEHNLEWYETMRQRVPANVDLHYAPLGDGGNYSRQILKYNNAFDIIMIDGRDRNACAKNALGALKEGGVILWDNSEREKYAEGQDYLRQNGFKRLDFTGLGPLNFYAWGTSLFYRSNNCFDI